VGRQGVAAADEVEVGTLRSELDKAQEKIDRRAREIGRLRQELENRAEHDEMTQLLSRPSILERVKNESARAIRYDQPLTLMLVDIDGLERVNEEYGREKGDEVIRRVAQEVKDQIRATDLAGRYEGEEFLVLCPNTDRASAQFLAERLRRRVAELFFTSADGDEYGVTVSEGLVTVTSSNEFDVDAVLAAADQALTAAKSGGRNRVKLLEVN
jgi:diguanylate cyclase (GGDEF)-like protein